MPPRKKNFTTKSYRFKLQRDQRLNWFKELVMRVAILLLNELWSEEWIERVGKSGLKAYKVINEAQAQIEGIYLPSRIRRGIAERVGRIIRGQYKRMKCYYDCLEIINWLGFETKENKLLAVVMQHYRTTSKKNSKTYPLYKKVMVEQTIAMIKNWYERFGSGFTMFSYTDFVAPKISRFSFPLGPDDGQAVQYYNDQGVIHLRIKLPKVPEPRERNDWEWVESELVIPGKVRAKIRTAVSEQPRKPTLITKRLKGGLEYFFLQFPWEYKKQQKRKGKERVLAIDLGLKKLATCIVGENGKQISKSITIKLQGSQYRHIERLYTHIAGIQKKLSKLKKQNRTYLGVMIEEERRRLYEKRNRLGDELVFATTNTLIQIAQKWQCAKIVIEDLRSYKPPRGKRSWSRRLSEWLRGRIALNLEHKCQENGLTLQKVCPWSTSTHCPRCTAKGTKVLAPNNLVENKCGRFFHCPECGFTADRDYIAAVNIYRASFIDYRKIKSLKDTSPVPYMDSGILHPTVPGEGSEMISNNNGLVAVTGNEQIVPCPICP